MVERSDTTGYRLNGIRHPGRDASHDRLPVGPRGVADGGCLDVAGTPPGCRKLLGCRILAVSLRSTAGYTLTSHPGWRGKGVTKRVPRYAISQTVPRHPRNLHISNNFHDSSPKARESARPFLESF